MFVWPIYQKKSQFCDSKPTAIFEPHMMHEHSFTIVHLLYDSASMSIYSDLFECHLKRQSLRVPYDVSDKHGDRLLSTQEKKDFYGLALRLLFCLQGKRVTSNTVR